MESFLTGVIPPYPPSWTYIFDSLADWKLLGNNEIGDCAAVSAANMVRTITALLGSKEMYPSFSQVEALYRTQNPYYPAQDEGMDLQTMFEYMLHTGWPNGQKIVAFAKFDPNIPDVARAAISIFGTPILGAWISQGVKEDFYAGRPWDYHPRSPILGGHAVMAGAYKGESLSDVGFVSWAEECYMTDAFLKNCMMQAWIVIRPEHLATEGFQQGIDLAALKSAYQAFTGRSMDVPTLPPPSNPGCFSVGTLLRLLKGK